MVLDVHEDFRTELRAWLAAHVPADPEPVDTTGAVEYRREWQRLLHDHGWAGISWPAAYGGRDAGPLEQFIYYEELARAGAPAPVNEPGLMFFGPALMVHGSEMLKRRYLPRILSAQDIFCQGFSEPDAGSDLASLRTRAEPDDAGNFVITGQKMWSTWAPYADRCALLCRTDPDEARHRGLSLIIVDMHQDTIDAPPIRQMTGQEEFGEIHLDGATAPADHLVGELHDGWAVAMTMLEIERSDVGLHDHARLEVTLDALASTLVAARDDGELTDDEFGALSRAWVDARTRCRWLRELNLALSTQRAHGHPAGEWGSAIRLYWSEVVQAVGALAMDLAGPDAPLHGDAAQHYLYGRSVTVASGTTQIQRSIVAERLLGLPR